MITKINLDKIKGYIGLSNRAGFTVYGSDNLKSYTHKLYLVLYREDSGKTIDKIIEKFMLNEKIQVVKLCNEDFKYIVGTNACKLLAIKNKGISDQILKLLRSEQIG